MASRYKEGCSATLTKEHNGWSLTVPNNQHGITRLVFVTFEDAVRAIEDAFSIGVGDAKSVEK